jgi:ribonuclease HI
MLRTLVPLTDGQTVDSLLDEETRSWNVTRVRSVFEESVAVQILQIPISRHRGDDFLSWPHSRFGLYTVRSAYHLARSERAAAMRSSSGRGMASDSQTDASFWKSLWAIKVPGKMCITLWRFAHNCLPTGQQFLRRHIPASPACVHCSVEESVEHAMLFCPYAREVWSDVKKDFDIHLNRKFFTSPKTWLMEFLSKCGQLQATALAVTFWHIWDTRNKIREEGGCVSPVAVAARIKAYIDFILTNDSSAGSNHSRETSQVTSWSPPPEGVLQLNVDAAIFGSSQSMGASVVVRDHLGSFIAAASDSFQYVVSAELAEAFAIRFALSWAVEEGLDNFRVASDCLAVVQRVNSVELDRSMCGPVIQDIKNLVATFNNCSILFVRRVQNFAAHYLARSSELSCKSVWRGVPPVCIRDTICTDSLFR